MSHSNKRKLVSVLGSSPAVITETLYALKDTTPFPSSINIFTTTHGKNSFENNDMLTIINQLCEELSLTNFSHNDITIHVVTDTNGVELSDLRTESDQEAMANFITNEIRQLVRDPNTSIHASIAGGRKSMSFYMGYIFSMFARPQDELSHVLVSPGYEVPGFYYPTKESLILESGKDAKNANVELALIPFIRLNTGLQSSGDLIVNDDHEYINKLSYSESIAAYQLSLTPQDIKISVDTKKHTISINKNILNLSAPSYAFYRMVLEDSATDNLSIKRSEAKPSNDIRFLRILADMCQFDLKDEKPIDCIEQIREQLLDQDIYIDQRTIDTIEENGLTRAIFDRFKKETRGPIQEVAFGSSVDLCEINIVKEGVIRTEPDARPLTKSGYYGVRLNPNQISIV